MATLAVGDVTTQLRTWVDANATGGDVNTKMTAPLATATGLAATVDLSTLLRKYIAR